MGSYVKATTPVPSRWPRFGDGWSRLLAAAALVLGTAAAGHTATSGQATQPGPVFPPGGPTVRLQLRVFDGVDDVTRDTTLRLYPSGQRDSPIPLTLGPDQAYETDVPVGLYDVQAIRERAGEVTGVRWVERLLVQKYPDEFGRHLQVVNLRSGFGALQIRPQPDSPVTPGWTAVATRPGVPDAEVGRARAVGPDLLLVVPSGTYDVKITVPNTPPVWMTALEIPDSRTRLKSWPVRP